MRSVVLVVVLAALFACTKSSPAPQSASPTSPSAAASTTEFCSTLQQLAQKVANETQSGTITASLIQTLQQQATTAESALRGQEGSMDLATRTQADKVIGDLEAFTTWTPAQGPFPTLTFGQDASFFKTFYCS